jgi:serine/threonine protein kinase/Tfp pilus assembly protein PilF
MKTEFSALPGDLPVDGELERILESAIERAKQGEAVNIEQLAALHPKFADQLRTLFPTIEMLMRFGSGDSKSGRRRGTSGSVPVGVGRQELLGDFRLLREIGRGGMGVVYEAEQLSMGRRVALKILPFVAIAEDKSLKRFRNEVRAAAALEHPHIVSVYSIGEERGVHYYAMQLVRGQSLAELIRQLRVTRHQQANLQSRPSTIGLPAGELRRSELKVSEEAEARSLEGSGGTAGSTRVEQAHVGTVIDSRRPAEMFRVAARLMIQAAEALQHAHDQGVFHRDIKPGNLMLDAEGRLYITDFGLARIGTDAGVTMTGDLVGTLRYMAPEQALGNRAVVDHRADTYSLGVTLYELLTLEPAFDGADRGRLLRQIAEEDPRAPRKIDRRIPAELETITLKAMAKAPEDRYQSAQRLAEDLRAFLEDRPIKAKPPSLVGRAAKWSRRHRGLIAATAAILVVLTIGSLVSSALLLLEQQRTKVAAAESRAVVSFLVNDLIAAPKDEKKLDREVTVTDVLVNAEAKISKALADQPLVEAGVRQVMAESYRTLKKFDKAEPHARRALELRTKLLGLADHDTLQSTETMSQVLIGEGKFDEAERVCAAALETTRKMLGREHPETLASMRRISALMAQRDEYPDREAVLSFCRETMNMSQRVLGSNNRDTLAAMHSLAIVLNKCGYPEEADVLFEETWQSSRRFLAPDDSLTIQLTKNYASRLANQGQREQAANLFKQILTGQRHVLGLKDPDTLDTILGLANADVTAGDYDEAVRLCEEGLAAARDMYGENNDSTLRFIQELSFALRGQGNLARARETQQQVLDWHMKRWGPEDRGTIDATMELAYVEQLQGQFEESLRRYDKAILTGQRVLGPNDDQLLEGMHNRARVLNKMGKVEEASKAMREVLAARERVLGKTNVDTLGSMGVLAVLEAKQGRFEESRKLVEEATQHLPPKEWWIRNSMAWFLCTSKFDAIRDGHAALEMATKACELTGYKTPTCLDTLAAAYAETGQFEAAVKWSERTIELTKDDARREKFTQRLEQYRAGKPWRE